MGNNTPSNGPSTTPLPDVEFLDAKGKTQDELAKFKKELGIDETKLGTEQKEFAQVEEFFKTNKETIKKITRAELEELKTAIIDKAKPGEHEVLEGTLVVRNGAIEFDKNIDTGTTTPQPVIPEAIKKPGELTAPDIEFPEDWKNPPLDALAKNPDNAIHNDIWVKLLKFIGLEKWANWIIAKNNDPDFGGSDELKNTFEAAIKLWESNQSPSFKRLLNIKHISKKQLFSIFQAAEGLGLDLSVQKNIEAAFGGKHLDDPKLIKYQRIHAGISSMIEKVGESGNIGYDPSARLTDLLGYSKDNSLDITIDESKYLAQQERNSAIAITAPAPSAPETPTPITNTPINPDVIRQANISEMTKAEETDKNLHDAEEKLKTAQASTASDKEEKVKEAQVMVDTTKKVVKESVADSTKRVDTALSDVEKELQTARLEREQTEKELQAKNDLPSVTPDRAEQIKKATLNRDNAVAKEKQFQTTYEAIKSQKESIKPDCTAKIALSAAQESEAALRRGRESTHIIITARVDSTNHDQTEEQKREAEKKIENEFNEVKTAIDKTIFPKGDKQIDNIKSIASLEKKIAEFTTKYSTEIQEKYGIGDLQKQLIVAKAKYDLIKAFKNKEKDIKDTGSRINYGAWTYGGSIDPWIQVASNGTMEIDIAWSWNDATFLSKDDETVKRLGGLAEAVKIILGNQELLASNNDFTGKDGSIFTIEPDTESPKK